jgi:pilus assembly protein CpaB
VLVVLRQCGAVNKTVARTILQRIRVFAINEQTIRGTDDEGKMTNTKTVTLEVTPEQVEILALADRMGDLSLSIRPPNDNSLAERPNGTDVGTLLGSQEFGLEISPKDRRAPQGPSRGFADFVKRFAPPEASRVAANTNVAPPKTGPTMVIYEPDGMRRFEFGHDGTSPREVSSGGADTQIPGPADVEEELDPGDEPEMNEEGEDEAAARLGL